MTTKEINDITKAVLDGKLIQVKNNGVWETIYGEPQWHFDHCDYRIKPEEPKPKLRPYANAEEFFNAQDEHGMYLKVIWKDEKDLLCLALPIYFNDNTVFVWLFSDNGEPEEIQYNELLNGYGALIFSWTDGTPCGIIEEEQQ